MIRVNRTALYSSGPSFNGRLQKTRFGWSVSFIFLVLLGSLSLESCIGITAAPRTGSGDTAASISVTPSSIAFGPVTPGATATQSLNIRNSGTGTLIITGATVTGSSFSASGARVPLTIPSGQSVTLPVAFTPNSAGTTTGALSLTSNARTQPLIISLGGTGEAANLQLSASPSTVSFGNIMVGESHTQTITLTNTGNADVTVARATITGVSLSESGLTLPLTLSAGHSSNFNVSFAPSSAGILSGSITIVSNASNSPSIISVSGAGVSDVLQLSASPSSLRFGNVAVGGTGTESVTLSNTGNSNVTVSRINVVGAAFSATGLESPATLAAGQSSNFVVLFGPRTAGDALGTISVISNASNSPFSISLSGTGIESVEHSVTLSWRANRSDDEDEVRYYIYRSTQSHVAYARINSVATNLTTYTDSTVQSGVTYFYVVTAVSDDGEKESGFSDEATATIPSP